MTKRTSTQLDSTSLYGLFRVDTSVYEKENALQGYLYNNINSATKALNKLKSGLIGSQRNRVFIQRVPSEYNNTTITVLVPMPEHGPYSRSWSSSFS